MLDTDFMLVELSVMEQRYEAVLLVIRDGLSVVEVASRSGVSRQTVHSWLRRYEDHGLSGLADRSHRPRGCDHQMSGVVEALVLEMRRQNPGWGPTRLVHELSRDGVLPLPSRSGVYRALKRSGLIDPGGRRRRSEKFRRWERGLPMELWQMDVVGGVLLADGTELKCLTGVDDHSRMCVSAVLMPRANSRSVCGAFSLALERFGVPQEVLTDNGKVFTGRFGKHKPEVLFDRICRENGIDHLLTAPRSPTTTGKIERFHRTLRSEFLVGRVFESLREAQLALDEWVVFYNERRPHQALGMATPVSRFSVPVGGREADVSAVRESRDGDEWVARRVASNGVISVGWQQISVGKHREGRVVDVHVLDQMLQIWDGAELLKSVAREGRGVVRKKRVSQERRAV